MIGALAMYVITTGTRHFGAVFVVRRHVVMAGEDIVDPEPLIVAESHKLAVARLAKLRPGLTRIAPSTGDDAVIVETWI